MYTYIVTFELHNLASTSAYSAFFSQLKSYTAWANPHVSVWLVKTDKSVEQVRNELYVRMYNKDKLLVLDVTRSGWGSFNLSDVVNNWIKNNI